MSRDTLRHALVAVLCMGLVASSASAHNLGFTALAVPVDSILVDGSLDDWPDSAPVYRLEAVYKGSGTYDRDDPTPEDLTALFRVAWSPAANRVFVAVTVRDDRRMLGEGFSGTDAMELYVDGSHGTRNPQQYLMFPGDARYSTLDAPGNPVLSDGDIDAVGGRGAYTEVGDTVVYEWSVQAFAALPGEALRLEPNMHLGFDMAVTDKDAEDRGATWLSWSPTGGKVTNPGRMGNLVLLSSASQLEQMARVRGRVTMPGGEEGWRGMTVRLHDGEGEAQSATISGPGGAYELLAPPGQITLEVVDAEPPTLQELELEPGSTTEAMLSVLERRGSRLPTWPFVFTLTVFTVAAALALLPLRRRLALLGGALVTPVETFRLLARDPEWTAPCALALLSAALTSMASVNQYPGQLWGALLGMPGALATILLVVIPLLMFVAFVVLFFATWLAWAFCLWSAAHLSGGRGRFFDMVSATGYAGVPALLGLCVASLSVTFGWGGDDASLSHLTGLALWFRPDSPLGHVLARVELFSLWSWGLGAVAVAQVMETPSRRALGVTAACWVLVLALIYGFHVALQAISTGLVGGAA